jgi:hypothetical protein
VNLTRNQEVRCLVRHDDLGTHIENIRYLDGYDRNLDENNYIDDFRTDSDQGLTDNECFVGENPNGVVGIFAYRSIQA